MFMRRFTMAFAAALLLGTAAEAQQVVRVGVASIGAPFSFHDEATNTDQGIMVDLIKEIANTAGFKVQLQSVTFSSLSSSLTSNKIDLIAATFTVTPERKAIVAFSSPVYTDTDALLAPKADTSAYTSTDDLGGKVLGMQKGIIPLPALHPERFKNVRVYDGGPDVMRGMAAGDVEVGITNRSIAGYELKIGAFPTLQMVASYKPTVSGDIAFGLRKSDTALLNTVNDTLAKLRGDGRFDAILAKWGVTPG